MTVIVDNTGFSVLHWSRFTQAEFIDMNIRSGAFKQYQDIDRRILLEFTYQQIMRDTARITETVKSV
jgi:hypothetical protein